LAAVKTNSRILDKVPLNLRTAELCIAAMQCSGQSLGNVPEHLRTRELCLAAVKTWGYALRNVPDKVIDEEICRIAVCGKLPTGALLATDSVLDYVPERYRTQEIRILAVRQNGQMLKYIKQQDCTPEEYLALCLAAIAQNRHAAQYISDWTPEICWAVIKQDGLAAAWNLPLELRTPEMRIAMVRQNGLALEGMQNIQTKIPELVLTAVEQNGLALEFVVNQTPEIIHAAIAQNKEAAQFVRDWNML
jgi:hypothetical protein